jgi:pimeloyl-ACP methyl ester carboxylesterase
VLRAILLGVGEHGRLECDNEPVPSVGKFALRNVALSVRIFIPAHAVKPSVVLLHGMGDSADDWDVVAAALGHDRRVIALDLRGHGQSQWPGQYSVNAIAEDVSELLGELEQSSVDVVGHSLGGLVACVVAAAASSNIRRLVLEDIGMLYPRERPPALAPDGPLTFDWRVVEQVRPEIDHPSPDWPDTIARIQVPTLVITGERSFIPRDRVALLVETLPAASWVTLDADHNVHRALPLDYVRAVQTFLDG